MSSHKLPMPLHITDSLCQLCTLISFTQKEMADKMKIQFILLDGLNLPEKPAFLIRKDTSHHFSQEAGESHRCSYAYFFFCDELTCPWVDMKVAVHIFFSFKHIQQPSFSHLNTSFISQDGVWFIFFFSFNMRNSKLVSCRKYSTSCLSCWVSVA